MTVTAVDPQRSSRQGLARILDLQLGPFGGTAGVVLVAIGLLVIGLGWNGAAGSGSYVNGVPDIRAQLPWLISGGGLGLALVIVGAALMVTQAHRVDRARLETRIEELAEALRVQGGGSRTASATAPTGRAPAASRATAVAERTTATVGTAGLVVTGATSYHRPECRLAKGRQDTGLVSIAEAQAQGLKACRICQPD